MTLCRIRKSGFLYFSDIYFIFLHIRFNSYYHLPTKLQDGNVFSNVCLSFCLSTGGPPCDHYPWHLLRHLDCTGNPLHRWFDQNQWRVNRFNSSEHWNSGLTTYRLLDKSISIKLLKAILPTFCVHEKIQSYRFVMVHEINSQIKEFQSYM